MDFSVPKSVSLNNLERRNSRYTLRYFTEFDSSGGRLPQSGRR